MEGIKLLTTESKQIVVVPVHVLAGLRFLGKAINQETARCVFHILCRCDAAASKQPEASMARKVLQKWFVG